MKFPEHFCSPRFEKNRQDNVARFQSLSLFAFSAFLDLFGVLYTTNTFQIILLLQTVSKPQQVYIFMKILNSCLSIPSFAKLLSFTKVLQKSLDVFPLFPNYKISFYFDIKSILSLASLYCE